MTREQIRAGLENVIACTERVIEEQRIVHEQRTSRFMADLERDTGIRQRREDFLDLEAITGPDGHPLIAQSLSTLASAYSALATLETIS